MNLNIVSNLSLSELKINNMKKINNILVSSLLFGMSINGSFASTNQSIPNADAIVPVEEILPAMGEVLEHLGVAVLAEGQVPDCENAIIVYPKTKSVDCIFGEGKVHYWFSEGNDKPVAQYYRLQGGIWAPQEGHDDGNGGARPIFCKEASKFSLESVSDLWKGLDPQPQSYWSQLTDYCGEIFGNVSTAIKDHVVYPIGAKMSNEYQEALKQEKENAEAVAQLIEDYEAQVNAEISDRKQVLAELEQAFTHASSVDEQNAIDNKAEEIQKEILSLNAKINLAIDASDDGSYEFICNVFVEGNDGNVRYIGTVQNGQFVGINGASLMEALKNEMPLRSKYAQLCEYFGQHKVSLLLFAAGMGYQIYSGFMEDSLGIIINILTNLGNNCPEDFDLLLGRLVVILTGAAGAALFSN